MTPLSSTREIDISIDEALSSDAWPSLPSEEWLRTVVHCALTVALLPEEPGQVSLVVTDDTTLQELNRKYRGLNEVTDVLSFSTIHPGHWEGEEDLPDTGAPHPDLILPGKDSVTPLPMGEGPEVRADGFMFPTDQPLPLGEIIVSFPQTCRQAESRHESVERELALLIVHGVLHLVGHDHLEDNDTAVMQAKEWAALETLFPIGTAQQ